MFYAELTLINQISSQFNSKFEAIIAVDEVGRGCVAGPVLTCASLWLKNKPTDIVLNNCDNLSVRDGGYNNQVWLSQVRDSKKLTPQKRLSCFNKVLAEFNYKIDSVPFKNSNSISHIKLFKPKLFTQFVTDSSFTGLNLKPKGVSLDRAIKRRGDTKLASLEFPPDFYCVGFCLGEGDIKEVEEFNIWNAVQIASSRALIGLNEYFLSKMNIPFAQIILLMDGNKPISVTEPFREMIQATAIKGDDLFISVGLSSILAKVYRDLFMEGQDVIYPHFGFAQHKGYGTALHLQRIQQHGTCSLHRLSFLKSYL